MNDIYIKAIDKFGVDHQMRKVVEELFELGVAIMHYQRSSGIHNIIEEVADVQIMLEQMQLIFDIEKDVAQVKVIKLLKLQAMIDE
jgi:NTP pyrophosphatase (non-canonical NTP hydrolase)